MGSTADKAKGVANKVAGSAKQAVGKALGDHELQAEGKLQHGKGELQQAIGKGKEEVKKIVDGD